MATAASDNADDAAYAPQPNNNWSALNGGFGYLVWTPLAGATTGGTYMEGVGVNGRQVDGNYSFGLNAGPTGAGFGLSRAMSAPVAAGKFEMLTRFDVTATNGLFSGVALRTGNDTSVFANGQLLAFGLNGSSNALCYVDADGPQILSTGDARGPIWKWTADFDALAGTCSLTVTNLSGTFSFTTNAELNISSTGALSFAVVNRSVGANQRLIFDAPTFTDYFSTDAPITGFQTFGDVVSTNGTHTVTEAADAGIFKVVALPVGADSLKFRFKFTSPGDGDFLSVHWGTNTVLYIAPDLPLTRENWTEAEVSLWELAGQTDTLAFRLVSRNSTNCVVAVKGIRMGTNADTDGDGLSNTSEAALGTDEMNYDTDGDGIGDGDEANIYHTDPLKPDTDGDGQSDWQEATAGSDPLNPTSRFQIVDIHPEADGSVTIKWLSQTGKFYDVNRATYPTLDDYTTIMTSVVATPPTNSVTDVTAPGNPKYFYWIRINEGP